MGALAPLFQAPCFGKGHKVRVLQHPCQFMFQHLPAVQCFGKSHKRWRVLQHLHWGALQHLPSSPLQQVRNTAHRTSLGGPSTGKGPLRCVGCTVLAWVRGHMPVLSQGGCSTPHSVPAVSWEACSAVPQITDWGQASLVWSEGWERSSCSCAASCAQQPQANHYEAARTGDRHGQLCSLGLCSRQLARQQAGPVPAAGAVGAQLQKHTCRTTSSASCSGARVGAVGCSGGRQPSKRGLCCAYQSKPCVQVDIVDLWTNHTPWPFNTLPRTYSWLVSGSLPTSSTLEGHQGRCSGAAAPTSLCTLRRCTVSRPGSSRGCCLHWTLGWALLLLACAQFPCPDNPRPWDKARCTVLQSPSHNSSEHKV